MGKTLFILKENQIKKIIEKIVFEQQQTDKIYASHYGSTSAVRVSHEKLTTEFGLPDGKNHENYYYTTTTDAVLDNSTGSTKENLLSIFRPYRQYNPKDYFDFFSINNDALTNSGHKQYVLKRGDVIIASHNGLLAIARAMFSMNGKVGYLTINFGTITKNKLAKPEMISYNIILNDEKIFNLVPKINELTGILLKYAINPYYYKRLTYDATGGLTPEQLDSQKYLENRIYNLIIGYGSFLIFQDEEMRNEMLKNLLNSGAKTKIDFDYNSFVNAMKGVSKDPDFQYLSKEMDNDKKRKIDEIGKKYQQEFINAIKIAYIENFKLFVKLYLPQYQHELNNKINNTNTQVVPLSQRYYDIFHSRPGQTITSPVSDIQKRQYKPGS